MTMSQAHSTKKNNEDWYRVGHSRRLTLARIHSLRLPTCDLPSAPSPSLGDSRPHFLTNSLLAGSQEPTHSLRHQTLPETLAHILSVAC